jgi:hypothetical protein
MGSALEIPAEEKLLPDSSVFNGVLHVFVALDWGEEVNLARAGGLIPAEAQNLSRRRRTPPSIAYSPAPLRFPLEGMKVPIPELEGGSAAAEVAVFDFGGLSVALHLPFRMTGGALRALAGRLSDSNNIIAAARSAVEPVYRRLLPAILNPAWSEITEEYFVFQFAPGHPASPEFMIQHETWTASLLRLEAVQLSDQEIQEALKHRLSYTREDLFLPDWAASVLVDQNCEETLQTIEFVNLLLLEFRFLDERLDNSLVSASRHLHPLVRSRLPLWRSYHRPLRALGELKVEAATMLERSGNVLKLRGDQYLARVYILLAKRFHLEDWEHSIRRSLEVVESVYSVISDQSASYRTEFLEITVVILILIEIIMAFLGH